MHPIAAEYILFLAETITIVLAVAGIILIIASLASHKKSSPDRLEIKILNDRLHDYKTAIESAVYPKGKRRSERRLEKKLEKKREQQRLDETRPRVFVLNFDGDIKASGVVALAEEITAILTVATDRDEVVVKVYSPGGLVHAYGLAASQLQRIRDHGIPLTVAVDKVAASGGYMMACVANQIIAAPFAIVGSVGVVAQIPNLHRFLKKHDIDVELHTAGKFKRTLTVLGENTPEGREKFQHDLEETHQMFRDFVIRHRPQVDSERIATGEYWHASQAIDIKLVDALRTSDDYLLSRAETADILLLTLASRPSMSQRITNIFSAAYDRGARFLQQKMTDQGVG